MATRDPGGAQHQAERHVVVHAVVLELELARVARERDVQPQRPAHRVRVERHDAADLRERHREEHEVEAAQAEAEAQVADHGAEHRGQRAAHEHADPRGEPGLHRKHRGGVGPDPDEGGVAGRELARVAAHDVPRLAEEGVEEDEDEHGDRVGAEDGGQQRGGRATAPRRRATSRGALAEEPGGAEEEDHDEEREAHQLLERRAQEHRAERLRDRDQRARRRTRRAGCPSRR